MNLEAGANTFGGILLIGVSEDQARPKALVIYSASNEISCPAVAPKDEKWRASRVAAYCKGDQEKQSRSKFLEGC